MKYEISLKSGIFCQLCGVELGYLDPSYKKYYNGDPTKSNSYLLFKPHHTGEYRKRCFDCFVDEFGRLPARQNSDNPDLDWLLQIDTTSNRKNKSNTLARMIERYGETEGRLRWDSYREKQSVKNTLEYKQKVYGWSEEQFKEFNKRRAVTLENMITKHGVEEGTRKYQEYCSRQAYAGCCLEYFVEKHGEVQGNIIWKEVCRRKSNNLENFILRYGLEEGEIRWHEFVKNKPSNFYSSISQELFTTLENTIGSSDIKCRYGLDEFGVYDKVHGRYYKYDFCLLEQKKIIEFNGTYWHADPRYYSSEEVICYPMGVEKKACDVWLADDIKHQCAKRNGFDVFVVWESDYIENAERVLEECVNFIEK